MRKPWFFLFLALTAAPAAGAEPSAFSLSLEPAFHYPLGPGADMFGPSGRGILALEYEPPFAPDLAARVGLGYVYDSYGLAGSGSLSTFSAELGAAWRLGLGGSLSARFFCQGGLAWGFENGAGEGQGIPGGSAFGLAEAGAGLEWRLSDSLALRLGASYRRDFGLMGSGGASLGVATRLPRRAGTPATELRLLQLGEPRLRSVFPVFRSWYDENPVGAVSVSNTSRTAVSEVRVTFYMKQYMDAPKLCATIPVIGPRQKIEVPLFALLNNSVLAVTETTKAAAEIVAEYRAGDLAGSAATTASVTVRDRNAMTWDDDRKAAAFVSGKDPWVLILSNQAANDIKPLRNPGIDPNIQLGAAFHEALRLYGVAYASSPTTPFAMVKANPETVDFLKYPRQTLSYRAGDCADLSILYASMFESVGVATAFITVPGHVFMAFALAATPEQAATMACAADLVTRAGTAWLPLEVTMRDADFSKAWSEGARQWREGLASGTAGFYAIRSAWETYPPEGLPADASTVAAPESGRTAEAFKAALGPVVDRELAFRLKGIEKTIGQFGATPKALNERGIAYARFGRLERAAEDFRAAGGGGPGEGNAYLPAIVNLGNVGMLNGDARGAVEAYRRAAAIAPGNAHILANLAMAAALAGDAETAESALEKSRVLDPDLGVKNASSPGSEGGTRSAEAAESLFWLQE